MSAGTLETTETSAPGRSGSQTVALVDLLDRLLGAGVVLSGDVTISIAGVDLVEIRLHALITSVRADLQTTGAGAGPLASKRVSQ